MGSNRMPSEDIDALDRIIMSNDWKIVIKYVDKLMLRKIEQKLLSARPEDMLLYEKGRVDGARELRNMLSDFKQYVRDLYNNGDSASR